MRTLFLLFSVLIYQDAQKNGVHISVEKDYGVRQTMNHFAAKELDTSFGG